MAIIVNDPFTEALTTNLASHTPNTVGDPWVQLAQTGAEGLEVEGGAGTCEAEGNEASDRCIYTSRPNPTVAEYDIAVDVPNVDGVGDDPFLIVARATSDTNLYVVKFDPADQNEMELFKNVAGAGFVSLGTSTTPLVDGDAVLFEIRDATKRVLVNASEEISSADNDITAAGQAGLALGNVIVAGDDISVTWDLDNYIVTTVAPAAPALVTWHPFQSDASGVRIEVIASGFTPPDTPQA